MSLWGSGSGATAFANPRRRPAKQPPAGLNPFAFNLNEIPKEQVSAAALKRQQGGVSNAISTGTEDAIHNLESSLAGTGASGALAERSVEMLGNAGRQAATQNASLADEAAAKNAGYALQRGNLGATLQNLNQDYGLGLRGQDLSLLQSREGNDVTGRGQELNYQLGTRGQDIDLSTEQGRQNLQFLLGQMQQDTTGRGQELDWLGQQLGADVTTRGQDISAKQDALSALAAQLGISSGERGQDLRYAGDTANQANENFYRQLSMILQMMNNPNVNPTAYKSNAYQP